MKTVYYLFLGAFAVFALSELTAARADDACLNLVEQSKTISLDGTLTHKVFPGPPNYEDVRKGDKPEPTYILQLQKPICALGIDGPIDRVQLFPHQDSDGHALWAKLRSLIGKKVSVAGTDAFGSWSGHHHALLLLPITEIKRSMP